MAETVQSICFNSESEPMIWTECVMTGQPRGQGCDEFVRSVGGEGPLLVYCLHYRHAPASLSVAILSNRYRLPFPSSLRRCRPANAANQLSPSAAGQGSGTDPLAAVNLQGRT